MFVELLLIYLYMYKIRITFFFTELRVHVDNNFTFCSPFC